MPATVDIASAPAFLQGIANYGAIDVRRPVGVVGREGVSGPTDLKVSQAASGPAMTVDVAIGEALIKGDTVAYQGLYYVVLATALTGATALTVPAAHASLPRVDSVWVEIKDAQYDGSGLNKATVRYSAGTATSGATAANRTGAPALPASAILLADVEVPAGATTVPNARIFDKRTFAAQAPRRVPVVTALPTPQYDGEEIILQTAAMATAGVRWHFVYNETGGTYKWEFVGGAPLRAEALGEITSTSTTYAALPGGPTVTVPYAGDYDVRVESGLRSFGAAPAHAYALPGYTGAPMTDSDAMYNQDVGTSIFSSITRRFAGVPASTAIGIFVRVSGAGGQAYYRGNRVMVTPVRL